MKLLVIGCGHSGTHWSTEVFRAAGLSVGHEVLDTDGIVSWFLTPDDPDYFTVAGHVVGEDGGITVINRPIRHSEFDLVLHQVRDPLASIKGWWEPARHWLVRKHSSARWEQGALEWACRYWLDWNKLAEEKVASAVGAGFTFRVEHIVTECLNRLGLSVPKMLPPPTQHSDSSSSTISLSDIPETFVQDICEQASRYGYKNYEP